MWCTHVLAMATVSRAFCMPYGQSIHPNHLPNHPYAFSGHEKGTVGQDFGARHYSDLARFSGLDPIWMAGVTPYHYVANNPLNAVDPDGRFFTSAVTSKVGIKMLAHVLYRARPINVTGPFNYALAAEIGVELGHAAYQSYRAYQTNQQAQEQLQRYQIMKDVFGDAGNGGSLHTAQNPVLEAELAIERGQPVSGEKIPYTGESNPALWVDAQGKLAIPPEIEPHLKRVIEALSQHPRIEAIHGIGSRFGSKYRRQDGPQPESDVDLHITIGPAPSPPVFYHIGYKELLEQQIEYFEREAGITLEIHEEYDVDGPMVPLWIRQD